MKNLVDENVLYDATCSNCGRHWEEHTSCASCERNLCPTESKCSGCGATRPARKRKEKP